MPIKIHDDKSPLQGAVMFLNASVAAYLNDNHARGSESKFKKLNQMIQQDLYITDLRPPTGDKKHHELDLVGFKEDGEPVCFSFRTDANLNIMQFINKPFNKLSEPSQEMAEDIQKSLGFEKGNTLSTM